MPAIPPWLFDDAAAYDAMRDSVMVDIATRAAAGDLTAAQDLANLAHAGDPFSRSTLDEFVASIAVGEPQTGRA